MSTYTCVLCGQLKHSEVEEYDYFSSGVACLSCLMEEIVLTEEVENEEMG